MSRTFYGGKALPVLNAGYPGWDSIPAFLVSKVDLMETTGWVNPITDEVDLTDYDLNTIKIVDDNKWWVFAEKLHRSAVDEAEDKSIPWIQAIGVL